MTDNEARERYPELFAVADRIEASDFQRPTTYQDIKEACANREIELLIGKRLWWMLYGIDKTVLVEVGYFVDGKIRMVFDPGVIAKIRKESVLAQVAATRHGLEGRIRIDDPERRPYCAGERCAECHNGETCKLYWDGNTEGDER